jgi:hypothetical protein
MSLEIKNRTSNGYEDQAELNNAWRYGLPSTLQSRKPGRMRIEMTVTIEVKTDISNDAKDEDED